MLLGIMAPVGWIALRLLLFWDDGRDLSTQVVSNILSNISLYLYMGVGTAIVLGTCGFFIGRATQQVHDRAHKLDLLNIEIANQKKTFERRFTDLDRSIKNFHVINMDLQRSIHQDEVLRLAANGLHEVIGYDRINILLLDEDETHLRFLVSRSDTQAHFKPASYPFNLNAGCIFKAVNDRQAVLVSDIRQLSEDHHLKDPYDSLPQLRTRSFIICPIIMRGQSVGVVCVDNKLTRRQLDETDVETIKLFADQISSSLTRIRLLDAVETLTDEIDLTHQHFMKYRADHGQLISSLRRSVESTALATTEITNGASVIQSSVDTTLAAAGEISASIDHVASSMHTLTQFMDRSIAAMTEIQYTVGAVEERSVSSLEMSEKVKARAGQGVDTVGQLLERMQGILNSVEESEQTIRNLASKGEEVGSVTSVVAALTQKTSLLALNAAIIAAQAGEHGRSFAVVADEVRSLAQEAAASTDRIDRIIDEIQKYIDQNVSQVALTRGLVDEGLAEGQGTAEVLSQILESSDLAMTMANEIRLSTREISQAVTGVSRSVEELGEMSTQVSNATREESSGAKNIVASVEGVRSMTSEMMQATSRQSDNIVEIGKVAEDVSGMAEKIFDEMEDRRNSSLCVIDDLQQLKQGKG
ncbi:MAG: hypothetical protein C0614_01080, partial [Desulfuromonas sp.]